MKIITRLQGFWKDRQGGQAVEWPLVAALLGIVIIAAWGILNGGLVMALTNIGAAVSGTTAGL
jgi:Flp pilus assembly pilin Flp